MTRFQLILTSIFIVFIIAGVAAFATFKGDSVKNQIPAITIWGTVSETTFNQLVRDINISRQNPLSVTYVELSEANFTSQFVEALARGKGPDAVLIPQDLLVRNQDKFTPIPYTAFPERTFRDTFTQQAELYLTNLGAIGIPFMIDPLVMYWNRDTFTNASIARYPVYWDEISALVPVFTQRDVNSNIRKTTIALGEFRNIQNAREILGSLFLQAGNPVTTYSQGMLQSVIGKGNNPAGQAAIEFFTSFSNPSNTNYSWNRSLPSAKNYFLGGASALYLGFASELQDIKVKNPNLNFDVAPLPQPRGGTNRISYGKMYGFSIVRQSALAGAAYTVITELIQPAALTKLAATTYLPPVRRDMLAQGTTDPYAAIFYDAALISRGWLDPDVPKTTQIFQSIIEGVSSGREIVSEALKRGDEEIDQLLPR
ncbi:MAG: extracellular solute-binding protein [Candidatus Taylorbacteria bacterium]|nr:extracellular solute-binding protein [Candidatus Taylorbacteria bacterium]